MKSRPRKSLCGHHKEIEMREANDLMSASAEMREGFDAHGMDMDAPCRIPAGSMTRPWHDGDIAQSSVVR